MVAQTVKNLPTMRGPWVQLMGWEDLLEKGKAPTPGLLPGKFHGQRSLIGNRWDRLKVAYMLFGFKGR